ncbi:MAG: DNA polymerase/3'-5' exonuclease PolX [Nanoarchaeota archaeon]
MKNQLVAKILNNIADILELQEVPFKPQAYRKAALTIESLPEDVEKIYDQGKLEELPGVGEHLAKKIEEIILTGKLKYYETLKKEIKVDLEELNEIPFLGPKKIKVLYKQLGIKNVRDLEKAIRQQKLRKIAGFGEKTEQTLLEGIKLFRTKPKRFLYASAAAVVNEIKTEFKKYAFVQRVEIAGSFRRGKETVGDLDFLVVSSQPKKVMDLFTSFKDSKVLAKGSTKSSIRLANNMQIDLRVVNEKEFGSALQYFIGNKEHNVELRKFALKKGYTLSEYGLFDSKHKKWVAGRSEDEVYRKLGLKYIEPELRENTGEIEAALKNKLPKLITIKDVQGTFHNHSKWSDGNNSLLEMAQYAEEMKFKFISFNDHFGHMGITNPLTEKRLKGYLTEIDKVQKKVGLKVFSGVEVDILKDGSLPLSPQKLKELDVVVAAIHLSTRMNEKEMTARVCNALENYPVNILGHPTDRLLNERNGLALNLDQVFETARKNKVFLEINSSPNRLDLSGEQVKSALNLGCKFVIGTDAHDCSQLQFYPLAVNMARRGWTEKKDILNCWSLPKIEKALQK